MGAIEVEATYTLDKRGRWVGVTLDKRGLSALAGAAEAKGNIFNRRYSRTLGASKWRQHARKKLALTHMLWAAHEVDGQ